MKLARRRRGKRVRVGELVIDNDDGGQRGQNGSKVSAPPARASESVRGGFGLFTPMPTR